MSGTERPARGRKPLTKRQLRKRILRSIYDDSKPLRLSQIFQLDRPAHLTAAVTALQRRQRWAEVLLVLQSSMEMRLPPMEAYNAAAAGSAPWRLALQLLRLAQQRDLRPSVVTAGTKVKLYGSSGWQQVYEQLADLQLRGLEPSIRHSNEALNALSDGNASAAWALALVILEAAKHRELEASEVTGSLLVKHLEQKSWTFAIHIFHDWERQRLRQDAVSVNSILKVGSQTRSISRNFLEQLKQRGNTVDSATCSSAAVVADSQQLLELLEMVKASSQEPDLGAYTSLLQVLQRENRWELALEILANSFMEGVEAAASTAAAAVSACDTGGRWEQAFVLSQLLRHQNVQLDLVMASSCLSAAAGGSWSQAWQSFQQLGSSFLRPDVLTHGAVAAAAERGQQWQMALETMSWREVTPDLITSNSVGSACEKAQQWHRSFQLVGDAMAQRRIDADAISFNSAILACTNTRRWLHALALMELATAKRITPQVASFGALLMECEDASPSLLSCQEDLLTASLEALGLDLNLLAQKSGG